jgi:N-acetylmuramoyl-L-alanine amidase
MAIRLVPAPKKAETGPPSMDARSIQFQPLAYQQRLDPRRVDDIDLVVIHCTELPDIQTARTFGEKIHYASGSGNSGHYYVDRDGSVQQWVELTRVAHHVRGFNPRSLGIELINLGRYPHWLHADKQVMTEHYTEKQIESLVGLLCFLANSLPSLRWITGHQELDTDQVAASNDATLTIRRKLDPGPLFPWSRIIQAVPLKRFQTPPTSCPS